MDLNWEAIGAIGEILGAGAVLATLVYLGMQVRQLRKDTRARSQEVSMEVFSNWRRTLLESEPIIRTLAKANQGQELTEEDRIGLQTLADEFFFAAAVSYTYGQYSGSMHDETAEIQYTLNMLNANPALISEWARFRPAIDWLSSDFGKAVDMGLNTARAKGVSDDA